MDRWHFVVLKTEKVKQNPMTLSFLIDIDQGKLCFLQRFFIFNAWESELFWSSIAGFKLKDGEIITISILWTLNKETCELDTWDYMCVVVMFQGKCSRWHSSHITVVSQELWGTLVSFWTEGQVLWAKWFISGRINDTFPFKSSFKSSLPIRREL